jgi:hypothetical protein
MPIHSFSEAICGSSEDIAAAVARIEQNYGDELELHNVQAYLLTSWNWWSGVLA